MILNLTKRNAAELGKNRSKRVNKHARTKPWQVAELAPHTPHTTHTPRGGSLTPALPDHPQQWPTRRSASHRGDNLQNAIWAGNEAELLN